MIAPDLKGGEWREFLQSREAEDARADLKAKVMQRGKSLLNTALNGADPGVRAAAIEYQATVEMAKLFGVKTGGLADG